MAAVGLGRQSVEPFLRPGVIVGCENGSSSVTLTGDVEAVKGAVEDIKATLPNTLTKLLPGNRAYHSSHMNTIKSEYQDSIRSITARMSKIPFISSVTGELHDQPLDAAYWARNLASPVLFLHATKCLLQRAPANFVLVEIGPHPALSGPIRQTTLEDNQEVRNYVPTLRRGEDSAMSLMKCAGQLFQNRVELKLDAVVTPGRCLQDLPTYPWQRQSGFWAESVSSKNWRHRRFPKHELLGDRVDHTSDSASIWKNALSLEDAPWLDDHRISSQVVFPGMGYLAMAGEAVRQLCGVRELTYRRVHFKEMLVLSESSAKEVVTHLTPMRYTTKLDSDWYDFQISSFDS
jgi:acyl transferase domain-containing protein